MDIKENNYFAETMKRELTPNTENLSLKPFSVYIIQPIGYLDSLIIGKNTHISCFNFIQSLDSMKDEVS